jgi:site-specific DNA-methyltransferase (adenine-specific)
VSRRESHDASGFYGRFTPPLLSNDGSLASHRTLDKLIVGDARTMDEVPDASVALVVTSPPYFAGKEYEQALGRHGVPATYLEYLDLLRVVFKECVRTLEPGGRIAVNVANLGRRPYRSLSADVIGILQDDLRLLLRAEIIWLKQRGSSGSCAWGSFQRAANPVLRDLTERVIVASKGRFDRAGSVKDRARGGLPCQSSMTREDFLENTLDVWEIPADSATRVGHPAPFPVELPARLIELYTYRGDLVLDPFAGAGTTAVASVRAGRSYVGYDIDESYIRLAESRVDDERRRLAAEGLVPPSQLNLLRRPPSPDAAGGVPQAASVTQAVWDGRGAKAIARDLIATAGFREIRRGPRQPGGIEVSFVARDGAGHLWAIEVAGSFTTHRSGLKKTDVLWKALAKAAVLREVSETPLVLLTAGLPGPGSPAAKALKQVTGSRKLIHAVIDIGQPSALEELQAVCAGNLAS